MTWICLVEPGNLNTLHRLPCFLSQPRYRISTDMWLWNIKFVLAWKRELNRRCSGAWDSSCRLLWLPFLWPQRPRVVKGALHFPEPVLYYSVFPNGRAGSRRRFAVLNPECGKSWLGCGDSIRYRLWPWLLQRLHSSSANWSFGRWSSFPPRSSLGLLPSVCSCGHIRWEISEFWRYK